MYLYVIFYFLKKTNDERKKTLTKEWDEHFLFNEKKKNKDVRVFNRVFPFILFLIHANY